MKRMIIVTIFCSLISMTACDTVEVESGSSSVVETTAIITTTTTTTTAITTTTAVETTNTTESKAENNAQNGELEEPEHGTSAYVDYIAMKAKQDAATATNEDLQIAVDWLKDNTTAYFSGKENMEKTMYYGQLLEYKFKDTNNEYEKIGWQAFKTVKYVYRGVESVLDDVTHDNLLELQEMAENLPDIQ